MSRLKSLIEKFRRFVRKSRSMVSISLDVDTCLYATSAGWSGWGENTRGDVG